MVNILPLPTELYWIKAGGCMVSVAVAWFAWLGQCFVFTSNHARNRPRTHWKNMNIKQEEISEFSVRECACIPQHYTFQHVPSHSPWYPKKSMSDSLQFANIGTSTFFCLSNLKTPKVLLNASTDAGLGGASLADLGAVGIVIALTDVPFSICLPGAWKPATRGWYLNHYLCSGEPPLKHQYNHIMLHQITIIVFIPSALRLSSMIWYALQYLHKTTPLFPLSSPTKACSTQYGALYNGLSLSPVGQNPRKAKLLDLPCLQSSENVSPVTRQFRRLLDDDGQWRSSSLTGKQFGGLLSECINQLSQRGSQLESCSKKLSLWNFQATCFTICHVYP